jgi:solute carrier family 25 (mitochondrial S-adenosylmethionine transporter), member 26
LWICSSLGRFSRPLNYNFGIAMPFGGPPHNAASALNGQWIEAEALHRQASFDQNPNIAFSNLYRISHADWYHRPSSPPTFCRHSRSRPKLGRSAVDALCGAVGEVTAVMALYPLDTIKVQSQARSAGTIAVLRDMLSCGPSIAVRRLYAGVGSATLGAAAMGSIYLVAFYGAKRAGQALTQLSRSSGGRKADEWRAKQQGSGGREHAALIASAAGIAASAISSLIEAPIELGKVRAQAGSSQGSVLGNMFRAVNASGPAVLYSSFVPFLLKSIPNDVAELLTFSQLQDMRVEANKAATWGRSSQGALVGALTNVPTSVGDMLIGALAAATAAIVAMPFDTTFTRMHLTPSAPACPLGSNGARGSPLGSANAFFRTASSIVATGGGPGALFVGLVPRLLHTVPAGIVFWAAVEGTRRALEGHFDVEGPCSTSSMPIMQQKLAASGQEDSTQRIHAAASDAMACA